MIKRLQWKMVAAVMAIVTTIIALVCIIFCQAAGEGVRRASTDMLIRAAEGEPIRIAGAEEEGQPGNTALAYFLILTGEDGMVRQTEGDAFHFAVEPEELTAAALQGTHDTGELDEYNLRYVRRRTPDGWRIAFNDLGFEQQMRLSMIATSLLVGGGAWLLFLLLSIGLSFWATRPIEQAWNRQKQFIADASHEMKTPLTVILSNADMLYSHYGAQDAQIGRWLDNIRAEGALMRRLVESMLFLARSDAAALETGVRERIDWSDSVESSVLTFEPLVFEHGLTITSRIQPGCTVQGEPDQLRRLTDILLDNAVKYSLPGGELCVSLARETARHALLAVSNPSPEITVHQAQKLFDRFFRIDPARTGQKGYGLGLSIARSLTESAKGRIWMEYRAGRAYFYVRLPLAR